MWPIAGDGTPFDRVLQQIADAQLGTCIVKDLEHRFVRVNDVFTDALDLPAERLIGRTDLEIGMCERMVLGDPVTGWPGFWALDDAAIAAGCTTCTDESDVTYDGRPGHAAYTLRTPLYDEHGEAIGLLVQSRDVSQEVEIHQRMRSSLHALHEREADFDTLDSIMASLLRWRDVDALLEQIALTVIERTSADGAFLSMPDETGDHLHCAAAAGIRGDSLTGSRCGLGEGLVGRAWSSGHSVFVANADEDVPGAFRRFGRCT